MKKIFFNLKAYYHLWCAKRYMSEGKFDGALGHYYTARILKWKANETR